MVDDTAAPNLEPPVQYEPRTEVIRMLHTTKKCLACGRMQEEMKTLRSSKMSHS